MSTALVTVVAAVLVLAVGGAVYMSFPRIAPPTSKSPLTSTPPSTVSTCTLPSTSTSTSISTSTNTPPPTSSTGTSTPLEFPSGLPLTGSTANGTSGSLVLLMQANSVASITFAYSPSVQGYMLNGTLDPSVGLWDIQTGTWGGTMTFDQTPDVSVTAMPDVIEGNLTQTTTFVFTFNSAAASKGDYLLAVPMACTWIPFAVGLSLTQINYSSVIFVRPPCLFGVYDVSIVGLSGLSYAYIQL